MPGSGEQRPKRPGHKRVLIITRGTRGDVQPFCALARGLVLHHGCECTIATELCWKEFVKGARRGLPEGSLRFRPSGGDTSHTMGSAVARWALRQGQHFDTLQAIMFSRSEVEFFPSEGCFYHWAREENPDFIVFGFTLTHIAMILSEALNIPIVGFILQPTREIQSREVVTVVDEVLQPVRKILGGPDFNDFLRQLMDKLGKGESLNQLRSSRGLRPAPRRMLNYSLQTDELHRQRVPLIAPINQVAMAGQQLQCMPGIQYTDFIFLRLGQDVLDEELRKFIERARQAKRKVVAMTFSSMPVGERCMLEMAEAICEGCMPQGDGGEAHRPAVIVMAGGQGHDAPPRELQERARRLQSEGRLLLLRRGAAFGALFPAVDAVVLHGGLGVTSEAFLAGVPVVTTGILLMDQRYWAARAADLGVGPPGLPIEALLSRDADTKRPVVVNLVQRALDQRAGVESWHQRAKELRQMISDSRSGGEDGVTPNAHAVFLAGVDNGTIVSDAYSHGRGVLFCCRQQLCCLLATTEGALRCLGQAATEVVERPDTPTSLQAVVPVKSSTPSNGDFFNGAGQDRDPEQP